MDNKVRYPDNTSIRVITFLDHATGPKVATCEVVGRLVYEDDTVLVLRTWTCFEEPDELDNFNHEHVTIIKSTIIAHQAATTLATIVPD